MTKRVRVGLVGCGGMGDIHLRLLAGRTDVEVIGVCDERADRASRMASSHGLPMWTDLEAFLRETQPEALHVCSPSGLHAQHGMAAAEHGIHILCEKPLDIALDRADALIDICERRGALLGCIFQKRASPALLAVQRYVAMGEMGRILSCSVSVKWWRSQSYYEKDPWKGTWRYDGGALANQGIHSLDLLRWMAGPVAEVEYALLETRMHRIECEDYALAVVRFESGARGTIECTTCCRPDLATRLEIYGSNGSAAFDDARVARFGLRGENLLHTLPQAGVLTGGGSEPLAIDLSGHRAQIDDFYAAIAEGRPPKLGGREARPSIELLNRIYQKARPDRRLGY